MSVAVFLLLIFIHIVLVGCQEQKYDPCCSFPCQNYGICNRIGFTEKYYCDCSGTGFYGDNCEKITLGKWVYELLRPSPFTVQALTTNGKFIWDIINKIHFLHSIIMSYILQIRATFPVWPEPHNTAADYTTWDGYANKSYWALTLPPVPKNCPTPMGVAGPNVLPDAYKLVDLVFKRTQFKPCPRGTSAILPFYGQHFTHQGFKTVRSDKRLTWGSQSVDLSHVYGDTLAKQRALRAMKGGKMKMQIINGEEYPANVKQCPGVDIKYPPHTKPGHDFAMGHPFFAMLPTLLYWTTLWLREHNRIADIMAKEHPDWDDERLYQTSRLIVHGVTLKVTVEAYVQHVSGMHLQLTYEPDLLHNTAQRWASSRIHVEFNTVYHWHSMMPDFFIIGGKNYTLEQTYYNMSSLIDNGMYEFTTSLSNQLAGRGGGGRNMPKSLLKVAAETIIWNRQMRMQPFNRYRKYFRLPPYKTFEDLTGEKRLARVLSDLYEGDIDAVDFYVGIMMEKRFRAKMFGLTLIESIANYALRSVFSNTLGSPEYWRESTFGGKVGFDIVKSATMEDFVCRNIKGCPKIRMQIKELVTEDTDKGMIYDDLEEYYAKSLAQAQSKTEL